MNWGRQNDWELTNASCDPECSDKTGNGSQSRGPTLRARHRQGDEGAPISRQPMKSRRRVTMVGAFPPPVHGIAATNEAVRDHLAAAGAHTHVINVSAHTLARSLPSRFERLPRVVRAVLILLLGSHRAGDPLYMSLSGGLGQIYEIVFVLCARLRGLRLYLHHHSFAYLDSPSRVSRLLVLAAGQSAVHIALSRQMAGRLSGLYQVRRVVPISNSVFLPRPQPADHADRMGLRTLGFMSNLSPEKGLLVFLDLAAAVQRIGLPVRASFAGPFQDAGFEAQARARLSAIDNVEYVGPKHGEGKDSYLSNIDVLVFPTLYRNEAEPIVIHEAMSRGIPVMAYGRGCIPEVISPDSGLVIRPGVAFVPAALAKIQEWIDSPEAYRQASCAATAQFASSVAESTRFWRLLAEDILLGTTATPPWQDATTEKPASWMR